MTRFGPMRRRIFFFSTVLVTETSIVRSSRNSLSRTFSSSATAPRNMKSLASMRRRKQVRVASISLAQAISSCRDRSGISPICIKYIRTGSSIATADPPTSSNDSVSSSTASSTASTAGTISSSKPENAVRALFEVLAGGGAVVVDRACRFAGLTLRTARRLRRSHRRPAGRRLGMNRVFARGKLTCGFGQGSTPHEWDGCVVRTVRSSGFGQK